jgi:hypothetical protein
LTQSLVLTKKKKESLVLEVSEYDDRTHRDHGTYGADPMIIKYLDQLDMIIGAKPTHLFWHIVKNEMKLFSSRATYSHHIINIIKKYTGKSISNNTIRKIWETELIQSPEYRIRKKIKHTRNYFIVQVLQMKHTVRFITK